MNEARNCKKHYNSLSLVIILLTSATFSVLVGIPLPFSPLLYAVADNNVRLVCMLLHHQADPNVQYQNKATPLAHAVKHNYYNIVKLLVNCRETQIDKKDCRGFTPLMHSIHSEKPLALLQCLIKSGADIEAQNKRQRTPIMKAAICNRVDMLQELLSKGADLHAKDQSGYTAIEWAATLRNDKAVRFLVERGAGITEDRLHRVTPNHIHDLRVYIKPFNALAYQRSALIENKLYKEVPRVLATLIRQFETPVPASFSC